MRRNNRLDILVLSACLAWLGLGFSAAAADPPAGPAAQMPAPALTIGDVPPPLTPMAWVKGERVDAFARDHVYVVAFFATWCGASRQSMPQLSEVARRHAGKVTVIGINVRESERREANVDAVTRFVQERGADMDYTVAMDDPASTPMFTSWMRAAGMYAIPTAFIIGRDGRLAYIGIPIDPEASYGFERAIEQAVAGTSDPDAARRSHGELAEQIAHYLKDRALTQALDEAMQRKDYGAVLVEADKLVARDPELQGRVFGDRLVAMLHLDEAGALAFARRSRAAAGSAEMAAGMAGTIGSVIAYTPGLSRDAYETAVASLESVVPAQGGDYNTMFDLLALAKLQHQLGRHAQAIRTQQRVVDIARGRKDVPAEMLAGMEKSLSEYRGVASDRSP